jgi:ankyrin repeat protein
MTPIQPPDPFQQQQLANKYFEQKGHLNLFGRQVVVENDRLVEKNPGLVTKIKALFGQGPAASKAIKTHCNDKLDQKIYSAATQDFQNANDRINMINTNPPFWQLKKEPTTGTAWIHIACETGDLNAVNAILKQAGDTKIEVVNLTKKDGMTPLMIAAKNGNKEIVTALLTARPQLKDQNSFTNAFHLACTNDHLEIVQQLIDTDLEVVNRRDEKGNNSMHWAILKNNKPLFDLLKETGARIDDTDQFLADIRKLSQNVAP